MAVERTDIDIRHGALAVCQPLPEGIPIALDEFFRHNGRLVDSVSANQPFVVPDTVDKLRNARVRRVFVFAEESGKIVVVDYAREARLVRGDRLKTDFGCPFARRLTRRGFRKFDDLACPERRIERFFNQAEFRGYFNIPSLDNTAVFQ